MNQESGITGNTNEQPIEAQERLKRPVKIAIAE
jgi:hypothetical protein